jgi:hypothetical protein
VLELVVDGVYREDGVFSDVGVAVFEAAAADWDEWLEGFSVTGYFLEKVEGCAVDIFVGVFLGSHKQEITGLVYKTHLIVLYHVARRAVEHG